MVVDLFFGAAGVDEILAGLFVDGEEAHGGAVFGEPCSRWWRDL
jgi:hypothetical protein